MRLLLIALLTLFLTNQTYGQTPAREKLIELGKTYKDFSFTNEPTKQDLKALKAKVPKELEKAAKFIAQAITSKNKLLTKPFLTLPDDATLQQLYLVSELDQNFRQENPVEKNFLIDSLTTKKIQRYELVDNYYGMLFTAVGNKNQPMNLSNIDFVLKDYALKDDTEKGIFFLRCMNYCGLTIWGFINIVKPPNTKKAFEGIKKFPKFNGHPYYQYTDFFFPDFEMVIVTEKGIQSYKSYYLDKYYEALLSHLICLDKEAGTEKEIQDLLLGSILREKDLYKFTKHKDILEEIFKAQKRD